MKTGIASAPGGVSKTWTQKKTQKTKQKNNPHGAVYVYLGKDMKLSVMKSLVLNVVVGTLASGALYADVSLSKNLGECPVGPISHDFSNDAAKKSIKINTGNCTRPGAFNWSGAVANYNGTVHSGDNASGTHSGRFEGKGE